MYLGRGERRIAFAEGPSRSALSDECQHLQMTPLECPLAPHQRGSEAGWLLPLLRRWAAARTPSLDPARRSRDARRSEEHTSELQSLMRISYAVFCLKKKRIIEKSPQQQ